MFIMKMKTSLLVWVACGLVASADETNSAPAKQEGAGVAPVVDVSDEVITLLASGKNCLREERWTEAVALFEKARALQPSNNEAVFGLSAALIEMKRYDEALPMLEALAKAVPESPMVKNNLAWALLHAREGAAANAPRAIKLARSALLDVPSDFNIWNTLGEAYYAAGQFDKALKAAQSGLKLSTLAGVTNSPCRGLVARSRKAAGAAALDDINPDHP